MNEKPLERLNYYNGQRLQAADLKLEQDYHIRVRRWLNRSLYSAGIAEGLAVYAIKDQPRVRVTPGLAIDHLGREIILLEETVVDVVDGYHGGGPYLSIRYREAVQGAGEESCNANGHCERPAWGGPARILAEPVLELSTAVPNEASGRIPLAALKMGSDCTRIDAVDLGVRRYIGEGSANKVKQYALEGVRDIDSRNPGTIIFHVRGRQPSAVSLYLRAEIFPTYHYTEMGEHLHGVDVDLAIPPHTHGIIVNETTTVGRTELGGGEVTPTVQGVVANVDLSVWPAALIASGPVGAIAAAAAWAIDAADNNKDIVNLTVTPHFILNAGNGMNDTTISGTHTVNMRITMNALDAHQHEIAPYPAGNESHEIEGGGAGQTDLQGVVALELPEYEQRRAPPLKYVDNLQIYVDNRRLTDEMLRQIVNNSARAEAWSRIGNGNADHPLKVDGTKEIRLDYLPGVILGEGEHTIELLVEGEGNGGRIHFNLYVE